MEEGWLSGYIQDYDGQALTLIVPFPIQSTSKPIVLQSAL